MGRLEDIAERNRPNRRPRERLVVMFGLGGFLLLILGLMVFTNLGERPQPRTPAPSSVRRVDDVRLWTPRSDAGTDAR